MTIHARAMRALMVSLFAAHAWAVSAAPVVVTPGSLAGYAFFPPVAAGGGGSSGMQETLQTCFVEFSRDDRTMVMSTRNWTGMTKPITVFYKVIGGGAGATGQVSSGSRFPLYQSAGGSSVIFKNSSVIASAPGMGSNYGGTSSIGTAVAGTPFSGSFTLAQADTLRIVLGGGGGAGMVIYRYTGIFEYAATPGGGGSGWFGGGAGASRTWDVAGPSTAAGSATGGTGTTGGAGTPGGGSLFGGTNVTFGAAFGGGGGSGASSGGATTASVWNGFMTANFVVGAGGGGFGKFGGVAGDMNGGWPCSVAGPDQTYLPAKPTAFALSPTSGSSGYHFQYSDPASNSHNCYAGGGRGQVVFQYQAPTCELIPNWNEN